MKKPRLRLTTLRIVALAAAVAVLGLLVYATVLGIHVTREFEQRGWDVPAQVYAAPLELYAGRRMSRDELVTELDRLGYRAGGALDAPGAYRVERGAVELHRRAFEHGADAEPAARLRVEVAGERIAAVEDAAGAQVPIAELEPLLIGSLFPAHGEDRIVLTPEEIPELLTEALVAVEDRRFESHAGVDVRAIARAALVNLREGGIEQGASTLTQQLVRSYFLTNERTWSRKIREALMAIALELSYSKHELMHAYVNEVYLGQDGTRAIHGFGLGSRFFFGKPVTELGLHEIALLIAEVRGPSYYDPRRHPERALERRDFVLDRMAEAELITRAERDTAAARELGVVDALGRRSSYYGGFLDLVRRQLARDYPADVLEQRGLRIHSTLDPSVQAASEASLGSGVEALERGTAELDGAVVVTHPATGEVRALVGSRRTGFDGYNRALDARRPVGSLIKPAVYLAALESGRYSLASLVDDAPITVTQPNGDTWSPTNFDGEAHGPVTLLRALAESLNMATVRVGLDVGVDAVVTQLERLGLERDLEPYPSLLLGAVELTPLDIARMYTTLASGGFRVPLKSVRRVVDADGGTLKRYPLEIEPAADARAVNALNRALVEVMRRGTGSTLESRLPPGLVTAGKTGTSDGFRDSWFAGFTSDHLVVAWLGNDANEPIGLTGATGAGRVWADVVGRLSTSAYRAPPPPSGTELTWIDYDTGLATEAGCAGAVELPLTGGAVPPKAAGCGSDRIGLGAKIRSWFRNVLE